MPDCPEDVTIPVILLPGIMGSRLRQTRGGDTAWDPDSNWFMDNRFLYNSGTGSRPWNSSVNDARVAEAAAAGKVVRAPAGHHCRGRATGRRFRAGLSRVPALTAQKARTSCRPRSRSTPAPRH